MPRKKEVKKEVKKIIKEIKKEPALAKKKEPLAAPHLLRGMKDILPAEQDYWQFVTQKAENLAQAYDFQKIDTPILEETSLFVRGVGKETEIVEKQMFSFIDKGEENICLRPENTAAVVRAYIEHGMSNLPQPVKMYYLGPQFRRERPQAGRLRQFYQFGLEVMGEANPIVEAQIILFSHIFFKELGIKTNIQINSLGCLKCQSNYKKLLLNFYRSKKRFLCPDCQVRLVKNPLRILDCKNPECQKIAEEVPQMVDHLCEECKDHFIRVLEYLDELEIPYSLNSQIVRGLDYYTRTIFEIWPDEGELSSQSSLGAGGRYDSLIGGLGGNSTPACGVAYGLERIIMKIQEGKPAPLKKKSYDVFLAQIGIPARKKCLKLFEEIRKERIRVLGRLSKDSLRQQLEVANKFGIKLSLILGQKELMEGTIIFRDMESGNQESVNIQNVVEEIKKRLKLKVKKIKL